MTNFNDLKQELVERAAYLKENPHQVHPGIIGAEMLRVAEAAYKLGQKSVYESRLVSVADIAYSSDEISAEGMLPLDFEAHTPEETIPLAFEIDERISA